MNKQTRPLGKHRNEVWVILATTNSNFGIRLNNNIT